MNFATDTNGTRILKNNKKINKEHVKGENVTMPISSKSQCWHFADQRSSLISIQYIKNIVVLLNAGKPTIFCLIAGDEVVSYPFHF